MKLKYNGPWKIYDDGFCAGINDSNGNQITGGDPCEGWIDPYDQNTILMAAAPDMLDALIEIVKHDLPEVPDKYKNVIERATGMKIEEVLKDE